MKSAAGRRSLARDRQQGPSDRRSQQAALDRDAGSASQRKELSNPARRILCQGPCRTGGRHQPRIRPPRGDDQGCRHGCAGREDRARASGLQEYAADFAARSPPKSSSASTRSSACRARCVSAVQDIETRLKEIDEPRLTNWLLTMRRHERDFMLTRDRKYVGEFKKAVEEFSLAMEATLVPSSVAAVITNRLEKYPEGIRRLGGNCAAAEKPRRRHDEVVSRASSR